MIIYCLLLQFKVEWCVSFYAVCLHFQQIFIVMCVTLVPDTVLSRAFRSERRNVTAVTNTERSSTKFHILQPRKRASRNKRPPVYIKEKGPVKLTKRPTNSKQVRLFGRVGLFLYVNANGSVSGSLNQHSQFGEYHGGLWKGTSAGPRMNTFTININIIIQ